MIGTLCVALAVVVGLAALFAALGRTGELLLAEKRNAEATEVLAALTDELNRLGVPRLPTTLGEAIDVFATDDVVRDAVGSYIADQLMHVKRAEWEAYQSHISPWEHLRYGDL